MLTWCASSLSFGSYDLATACRGIRAARYDSVEIVVHGPQGEELLADPPGVGRLLDGEGLRLRSLLAATRGPADPGEEERIRQCLDIAVRLDCGLVTLASGGAEAADETETAALIAAHQRLATAAAQRGLILAMYAHRGTAACNSARARLFLEGVDSPAFRFYYSPWHFHLAGEDPLQALEALGDFVHCVYFNCEPDPASGRGRPTDQGRPPEGVDYAAVCRQLRATGFRDDPQIILLGGNPEGPEQITRGLAEARATLSAWLG